MRGFECYTFYRGKDNKLKPNSNRACFAGLNSFYLSDTKIYPKPVYVDVTAKCDYKIEHIRNSRIHISEISNEPEYIYIHKFREKESEQYIKSLVEVVNRITECSLVSEDGEEYIKYKLLDTYDQNLVLLNFIRNLWNNPIRTYSLDFLSYVYESIDEDALELLTKAHKKACEENKINNSQGHSNIHPYDSLKIKKTKELLEYKGSSTKLFLTDKN